MNDFLNTTCPRRIGTTSGIGVIVVALMMSGTAMAASVSSNVTARIGNTSGATYIDNGVSGYLHALPDDTVHRDASLALHAASGSHVANLSNAALAVAGSWSGTSIYGEPNRTASGGGTLQFRDEILVQSGTLAVNTPVTIEFAYYAATAFSQTHSNPAPNFGNTNRSSIDLLFSGSIRSGVASANDVFISASDHRRFEWLGSSTIVNGILDPANTPLLTVTYNGFVGETITFAMDLDARIGGAANPLGPTVSTTGNAHGALAIAFGATPVSSDVMLLSSALSGAFPAASMANMSNAQNALVAAVPLPPALLLVCSALPLIRRRRSRRR